MTVKFRSNLLWPVHIDGYEWRTWNPPEEGVVGRLDAEDVGRKTAIRFNSGSFVYSQPTDRFLVPRGAEARTYRPEEEHPSLFRAFSQLAGSPESILAFANRYGRLAEIDNDASESVSMWLDEIRAMDRVVKAWDFLRGRSTLAVEDVLRRVLGEEGDLWVTQFRRAPRQMAEPLRSRLALEVRSVVTPDRLPPGIMEWQQSPMRSAARCFLVWDDDQRLFRSEVEQTTLLSAIWGQAVKALTGIRDWRKCDYNRCLEVIEVSGTKTGRTERAKYCSDSHRALASRLRRIEQGKASEAQRRPMARRRRPTAKND